MDTFNTILHFLHGWNRWLAILTGVWALSLLLPGITGKKNFTPATRYSVVIFTGTVHLQISLGVLTLIVIKLQGMAPFSGHTGTVWAHILGGVLAATFAALAIRASKRAHTDLAKFRFTALWSTLTLIFLERWIESLILLGLLLLFQWVLSRLKNNSVLPAN